VLTHREKLRLGDNDFIQAVYHSSTRKAKLYQYFVMDKENRPIEFNVYSSDDIEYIPLIEKTLSTLKFGLLPTK
jgi:hypothetical protein